MISIIIISKNEEDYLPYLLESIRCQDAEYEIILSDAKSTDRTREIAKKYGCRIVEGGFPSVGRNNGAKAARYENLLFLDADVVLSFDFLNTLEQVMKDGIECGSPRLVPLTQDKFIKAIHSLYNIFSWSMQNIVPFSGGMCIFSTKRVFNAIGGFNEKMLLSEDHDYVTRASKVGKFKVAKELRLYCDIRRIRKEGKMKFMTKYLKGGAYRILFGDSIKPPFEYVLNGTDESVTKIYERIK